MPEPYSKKLLKQIEQNRRKMISLAKDKSLTHSDVISISQDLDTLLNQLQNINREYT